MSEPNPYKTPDTTQVVQPPPTDAISSTRYLVNVGCGVAILVVWVPATLLTVYQLFVVERTLFAALGLGLNALFLLGCVHSVAWAIKRRRHERAKPRVVPVTSDADKEHRRMYGY